MRIDLHAHSTASDGTDSPAQLVEAAAQAGLDMVAITDHDSTAGWAEAETAARRLGIGLVRGIEVSTQSNGISVHMLGYLHDPHHPGLLAELEKARVSRGSRAQRIVELLARDVPLTWADVRAQVSDGATIGRPHIADALVAKGVVPDRDTAFRDYLYTGSPYYAKYYAVDSVRAVQLIREAGGVAVMAHPFAAKRGRIVSDRDIAHMADAGLFALEAHHPEHTPEQVDKAVRLAAELDLPVTGSSDYHGTGKANRLGERLTDPEVLAALEAAASATAVIPGRTATGPQHE